MQFFRGRDLVVRPLRARYCSVRWRAVSSAPGELPRRREEEKRLDAMTPATLVNHSAAGRVQRGEHLPDVCSLPP